MIKHWNHLTSITLCAITTQGIFSVEYVRAFNLTFLHLLRYHGWSTPRSNGFRWWKVFTLTMPSPWSVGLNHELIDNCKPYLWDSCIVKIVVTRRSPAQTLFIYQRRDLFVSRVTITKSHSSLFTKILISLVNLGDSKINLSPQQ